MRATHGCDEYNIMSKRAAAAHVGLKADGSLYVPPVEPEPEPELEHVETTGGFHGDAEVGLGQSMVMHGVASFGPLRVECGSDINEQLWGAGVALSTWFMHAGAWPNGGRELLAGRPAVLELGSGTGIAGMACACAGAGSVILTDLPQAVLKLEEAIEENEAALEASNATVTAAALTWGDLDACYDVAPEGVDLVIGADLLYNPNNFDALLATMLELALIRGARILLATENRWGTVNSQYRDSLARSGLEEVGEPIPLPAPSRLPRPVMLVELAPKESE
eukprot:COSAG02_NODE_1863_length_10608_cov_128.518508_11_plen_279_part_00